MEFDNITKEEETILKAFLYLWNKRCITTIFVNEYKRGICFCKTNNKWASFHLINDVKYNYEEFDNVYLLCLHYFNYLNEYNSMECLEEFPIVLSKVAKNEPLDTDKYVPFDELEEDEKTIFNIFIALMGEISSLHIYNSYPEEKDIDKRNEKLYIYKRGNKWIEYYLERNEKVDYSEYDDLLSLCYDIFEIFEKSNTDYCNEKFPIMLREALDQKKK